MIETFDFGKVGGYSHGVGIFVDSTSIFGLLRMIGFEVFQQLLFVNPCFKKAASLESLFSRQQNYRLRFMWLLEWKVYERKIR